MHTQKEIRGMSEKELHEELSTVRRSLLEMRMGLSQSQLKKTSDIKESRRYVARMLTEMAARQKKTA